MPVRLYRLDLLRCPTSYFDFLLWRTAVKQLLLVTAPPLCVAFVLSLKATPKKGLSLSVLTRASIAPFVDASLESRNLFSDFSEL